MDYRPGIFARRCSSCTGDSFTIRADGKTFCSACKLELKSLGNFTSDELDDLWIAVQDRLLFLEQQVDKEPDNSLVKPVLQKRAKAVQTLLTKIQTSTPRKGNTPATLSG